MALGRGVSLHGSLEHTAAPGSPGPHARHSRHATDPATERRRRCREGWEIRVFSAVRAASNRHPPADGLIVIFWMSNRSKQNPLKCISAAAFLTEGVGFPLTRGKRELEQKTSSALELIK